MPSSRLFPYSITIGALTLCFIIYMNIQRDSRNLLPDQMMVFAFMFFVLYMAGLVECSIQLFGAGGNVSGHCATYVYGQQYTGESIYTLAWLEQYMICEYISSVWESRKMLGFFADAVNAGQGWYSSFAFYIVGIIFFIWLFVMAIVVMQNQTDVSHRYVEEE